MNTSTYVRKTRLAALRSQRENQRGSNAFAATVICAILALFGAFVIAIAWFKKVTSCVPDPGYLDCSPSVDEIERNLTAGTWLATISLILAVFCLAVYCFQRRGLTK